MIGKKINQLATELAPASTDLTIIGNPTTGVSKKITLAQLGAIFSGAVSFYTNLAAFPTPGTTDVIYCAKDTQKLYLWSGSAYVEVFPSQALLDTYQLRSEKGNANGYASLDSGGKVPISQLPSSIMEYKGTWNASTNTPTLANGTGDTGDVYICNVAGTVNFGAGPITFAVGDYVIYSGTIWQRSSGAVGTVTSVALTVGGDAISVSGSPLTTSGTLALAFSGTTSQYIRGNGTLANFPTSLVTGSGTTNFVSKFTTSSTIGSSQIYDDGTSVLIGTTGTLPNIKVGIYSSTQRALEVVSTNANALFVQSPAAFIMSISNGTWVTQFTNTGRLDLAGDLLVNTIANATTDTDRFLVSDSGVIKYRTGAELLSDIGGASASGYVPYTGATANLDLGTHTLIAAKGTFSSSGSGDTVGITHSSGSGIALNITKGGNGEGLYINKTSGSGNAATIIGTLNATTLVKSGGTSSQFLKADGSVDSNTYYLASNPNAYIALTAISAGAGISYNNTTGVIASTITQYTDALARASISLTTSGTSGAATYNSTTGVLNVPQYAPDLSGYVPISRTLTINGTAYDLSANRSWSVGTVTSVGLSSATSGVTIGSTPITTSGTITLAIATASGSQQGLLSSTDWTTFNNKQNALTNPVTGTGTTNYLPKFTGASTIGDSVIHESAGGNIGIGNTNNTYKLDVTGNIRSSETVLVGNGAAQTELRINSLGGTNQGPFMRFQKAGSNKGYIGTYSAIISGTSDDLTYYATGSQQWLTNNSTTTKMLLDVSGNLGLGVTPSAWLNTLNALQIGAAHLFGQTTGTGTVSLGNNAFLNSTPAYIYQYNGRATRYSQYDGQHEFYTAPSGTAGNAISFTQAMTLDASGRLGIGTTFPNSTLQVRGDNGSSVSAVVRLRDTNSTARTTRLQFEDYNGTLADGLIDFKIPTAGSAVGARLDIGVDGAIMSLVRGGNVGIGTTAPNSLLEVNRTITFSSVDTYGQLVVKTTSGANGKLLNIGVDETNSVSFIQSLNRGTDVMPLSLQRYGGAVLIGTTTEGFLGKLQVAGSVAITGQYNTVLPSSSFSYFDGSGQVVSSSSNASALYLDTTWNTTGNPDGIYLNVTNTASGASSKLLNLKVGSVSQFSVSKAGAIQTTAPSSGSAQPWKLGSYAAGGTGTATGVIYIEINGQIYSIPALQGTP